MSVITTHKKTVGVKTEFAKEVEGWKSLKLVDSFFVKYQKISPNEALSNALELKDLVKKLKDTIKPIIFEVPSFNTRVNILYNETLRLADLIDIKAIKATEVNEQVAKTIDAFSSVKLKINTMLLKKKYEDELYITSEYIGLDSTRIDSVSKNSIDLLQNEKLKGKLENKKDAVQ
ncbi:hypothetical protein [uncultured Polaribacter sp.]|uniref:hypothetical protein n=1 Tax=uncultured Polaribacter sp. TaxID=174711 RepID=UPI002618B773|nr:hypothetical protein [uncultured Polaribacter sp.]